MGLACTGVVRETDSGVWTQVEWSGWRDGRAVEPSGVWVCLQINGLALDETC